MTQDGTRAPLNHSHAWQGLDQLAKDAAAISLSSRFASDPERAQRFSGEVGNLFVDYSKHHLDSHILDTLCALAEAGGLASKLAALRQGAPVNNTEDRKACYPTLRRWGKEHASGDPAIDTMLLFHGYSGRLGHYTLDDVASACKVEITDRHSALGDARATCEVFCKLAGVGLSTDASVGELLKLQTANEF